MKRFSAPGALALAASLIAAFIAAPVAIAQEQTSEVWIDVPYERFELPNLRSLNFLLHESLGGGGTVSLMLDAQGKTFATALLRMEIEVPDELPVD